MTLNELKNEVACLGFESYIEDEDCFITSANRALSLIYTDRPVTKTALVSFTGPKTTLVCEFIEHKAGKDIRIPVKGRALSFRTTGNGSCTLKDAAGSTKIPLTRQNQLTRQIIFGDGELVFSGDYYFTVSNLAVFDDVVSNDTSDVPEYKPFREIPAEDVLDGFRSFSGLPFDKDGRAVDTIKLRGGKIYAPFDYRAEVYITYARAPEVINPELPDSRLDLSEECAPMLPLLTASFMWLDDDASKAQYYMSLYRDLIANVKRYSKSSIDTTYGGNGWA